MSEDEDEGSLLAGKRGRILRLDHGDSSKKSGEKGRKNTDHGKTPMEEGESSKHVKKQGRTRERKWRDDDKGKRELGGVALKNASILHQFLVVYSAGIKARECFAPDTVVYLTAQHSPLPLHVTFFGFLIHYLSRKPPFLSWQIQQNRSRPM